MKNHVITLSVVFAICFAPYAELAFAKTLAPPGLPEPSPYLKSCEGFLDALTEDRVEDFFLAQARTPGERLQLLLDYRIVFTKRFARALRSAQELADTEALSVRDLSRAIGAWRRDTVVLRRLVDHVLDRLADPSAAGTDHLERLHAERTRRFIEAMRARGDFDAFVPLLTGLIEVELGHTVREAKNLRELRIVGHPVTILGQLGGAGGVIYASSYAIPLMGSAGIFGVLAGAGAATLLGMHAVFSIGGVSEKDVAFCREQAARTFASGDRKLQSRGLRHAIDPKYGTDLAFCTLAQFDVRKLGTSTPVDLAYLGIGEAVELVSPPPSSALAALRESSSLLEEATRAAGRLATNADDLRGQLLFAGAVRAAGDAAQAAIRAFDQELGGRRERLAALVQSMNNLEQECFANLPAAAPENDLLRREIVICRSRHDRPRLAELVVTGGPEGEIVDLARPLAEALLGTVRGQPRGADDWRTAAARATDLANDLRRVIGH